MTPGDIISLFFPLSAFQPVLKQRFLEATRQRLIARIEAQHNSRVILLVHRQETMSFLGFPILRYIDVNDSEGVLRAIHLTDPSVPIDLVLHTPGGLVLAALQIARAISNLDSALAERLPCAPLHQEKNAYPKPIIVKRKRRHPLFLLRSPP